MLREDTLRTVKAAIARGEPVTPTPDIVRALQSEARRLRVQIMRELFRKALAWLSGHRDIVVPAGKIDVVRGH